MNYYDGVICHLCGMYVCSVCGCCQNSDCTSCSCPDVIEEEKNEKENKIKNNYW